LGIAERLLAADRAEEALTWLGRPSRPQIPFMTRAQLYDPSAKVSLDFDIETLKIRALERLGRRDEAQTIRWRVFEHSLDADILRGYVRALGDFEEFEALDRALALASAHRSALRALGFFLEWNKPDLAAKLVCSRLGELDGRLYDYLGPAAEALSETQPRAATLLYRRMIDSVLERGASKSYSYAARDLTACAFLADGIEPTDAGLATHTDYVRDLRARHGRKYGFWDLVGGQDGAARGGDWVTGRT
jgi:hypothetical protein